MAIGTTDLYLRGRCQLSVDGQATEADCYLNLVEQRLECSLRIGGDRFPDFSAMMDGNYTVTALELSSPVGRLTCERVPIAFVSSVGGGGWSIAQTSLSQALAIDPKVIQICFVLNEALELSGPFDGTERLFCQGFDTIGTVNLGGLLFNGTKDRISLAGQITEETADLRVALGMCVGVPAREFALQEPGKLSIWLNNFQQRTTQPRPFIFVGETFREVEVVRQNLTLVYDAARSYLLNLPPQSKPGARNAILTFLHGRALASSYELKLLAAFHFLEWFDGSKTLSAGQIAKRLDVSRAEAEAIVRSRNDVVHNLKDISAVIETAWSAIRMTVDRPVPKTERARLDAGYGYLNYLYSLLGNSLMREIGYDGKTQPYLP